MYVHQVIGNRLRGVFDAVPIARALVIAVAALGWSVGTARATTIWVEDSTGKLGIVDVTNKTATVIGSSGNGVVLTDIAFDASGNLYGIDANHFYSVNKTTGHATLIGTTGLSTGNGLVFSSNGTLYASNDATSSTKLYTLNKTTGAATALSGSIGFHSSGDLAFNQGSLYMSDTNNDLVKISLGPPVSGVELGPFGHNYSDVYGLATGDSNILYGIGGTFGSAGSKVFSINTTTGAGSSVIFDYSTSNCGLGDCYGAAAIPPPGVPVPEPVSLAMLLIGGPLGLLVCRKSCRAALVS